MSLSKALTVALGFRREIDPLVRMKQQPFPSPVAISLQSELLMKSDERCHTCLTRDRSRSLREAMQRHCVGCDLVIYFETEEEGEEIETSVLRLGSSGGCRRGLLVVEADVW